MIENCIIVSIHDCPFDLTDKEVFGFVFSDECGIVEDIAFNLSNTTIAYAGMYRELLVSRSK